MSNKLSCNPQQPAPVISRLGRILFYTVLSAVAATGRAYASSDAPQWMRAVASAPLPAHDDKTDAVILYEEYNVNVVSADKVKIQVRRAYKILRPSGREYGIAAVSFNPHTKINGLRGWCIPAQGKDYEVKDKEAVEVSLPRVAGGELISDVKDKLLQIPAADPGNIVGYEYEKEVQPMVLQEVWDFQREIPVRESHYSLQLPPGWAYKALWFNYPETKPTENGSQLQWTISDVKGIREEAEMPPLAGVSGQMVVSFFPQGGASLRGFSNWPEMGTWYQNLTSGRRDASPEIGKKSRSSTDGVPSFSGLMTIARVGPDPPPSPSAASARCVRSAAWRSTAGGWQPSTFAGLAPADRAACGSSSTAVPSTTRPSTP